MIKGQALMSFKNSWLTFSGDIHLRHSIFALPFMFSGLVLAPIAPPSFSQFLLLVCCMVLARSFAMGFNNLIDRLIDFKNPRTRNRALPNGRMTPLEARFWSFLAGGLFALLSFQFNLLTGWCSFGVLAILAGYPYLKHVSPVCHWYLGLCLGLAPIAAAVALENMFPLPLLTLGLAICFWTAGFDILYAVQDEGFDRENKLHSIPSRYGVRAAYYVSCLNFFLMIAMLLVTGSLSDVHGFFYMGVGAVACLLSVELFLVRGLATEGKSDKINMAFFNVNACVSIIFYLFCQVDKLIPLP